MGNKLKTEMITPMSRSYAQNWALLIQLKFIPLIDLFAKKVKGKIVPSFDSIDKESELIVTEQYERLISSINSYEDFDEASVAESALDKGVDYLCTAENIKQGVLNLFVVSLYHIFEQQFFEIYRVSSMTVYRENDIPLRLNCAIRFIRYETNIDVKKLPSWSKIKELKLLANAVKHGDGGSCEALKKVRPDFLIRPADKKLYMKADMDCSSRKPDLPVIGPLAGQGIYVEQDDFDLYASEVKNFWSQLSEELKAL